MKKRNKSGIYIDNANTLNYLTFNSYYNRLTELAINMFRWENLPPEIDKRFLELTLYNQGMAVFFYDDVAEKYIALTCTIGGPLDIYRIPIVRRAYSVNGYNRILDNTNSVLIFNNYLHSPTAQQMALFAQNLTDIDRTINVNVKAQKTPIMIKTQESQRLTMKNLYQQYNENEPVIYGDKSLDDDGVKVLKTDAPFVADKLYNLKSAYWKEALAYLGIETANDDKKERLINAEVMTNLGNTLAERYVRLNSRRNAVDQINAMFGLNITVDYQSNLDTVGEVEKDESLYDGTEVLNRRELPDGID